MPTELKSQINGGRPDAARKAADACLQIESDQSAMSDQVQGSPKQSNLSIQ